MGYDHDSDDNSTLSSIQSDSPTSNLSPSPARRSRSSRSRRASKACLRQRSLVGDMDRINDEINTFQTFIQVGQERHDNDNDDNTVHTIEVLDVEGASSACGFMDCVAAYQ